MKISGIALGMALAASVSLSTPSSAATIVDTGTPVTMFGGYTVSPYQQLAGRFSVASETSITDVSGFIGDSAGARITIAIHADRGMPEGILYSGSFTTVAETAFQGLSGLDWRLDAGDYWISFIGSALNYMPRAARTPLAAYAAADEYGWQRDDGLNIGVRINGVSAAVPEPATWALMLIGFGAAGVALRRRRSGPAVRSA